MAFGALVTGEPVKTLPSVSVRVVSVMCASVSLSMEDWAEDVIDGAVVVKLGTIEALVVCVAGRGTVDGTL